MAFLLQNWGRTSAHANEPIYTLASGTVVGAPRAYSYYTADTQNTVATTANYFSPSSSNSVANDLAVGDEIRVYSSTDLTSVGYLVTAVNAATPSVTVSAVTGLLTANVTVTNAQILAGIYAHPVQIVAAPGASTVIVPVNATFEIVYGTVQFQNGGATRIQYDSTVHAGGTNAFATTIAAADINGATANNIQTLLQVAQAFGLTSALANKGLFLSCATGEFTAGDSTFKISVNYRLVNV